MLSGSAQNAQRSRLLQPQRKLAVLRSPDSTATQLAGVGGERVTSRVAGVAIADLGQQFDGGHNAAQVAEQRQEDLTVGVLVQRDGDLLGSR